MSLDDFRAIPNYVIDFETLDRRADAYILSASLASWWSDGCVQEEGYWRILMEPQPHRVIGPDTVRWWAEVALENPEAAREAFLVQPRVTLDQFARELREILAQTPEYTIWSKPQDFDLPILEHIHGVTLGLEGECTHYRMRHNCRTYWNTARTFEPGFVETVPTIKHHPVHDALAIADTCLRAFRIIDARRA